MTDQPGLEAGQDAPGWKEKETVRTTPQQVNSFHARSDKDSSPFAQHHTLGISNNQSSPGPHVHDGSSSRQLKEMGGSAVTGSWSSGTAGPNLAAVLEAMGIIDDQTTA